jgi:hypothetical protein
MQNKKYKIPDVFRGKPFFQSQTHFVVLYKEIKEILLEEPFYFDMLSLHRKQDLEKSPWNHPEESVPVLFNIWKQMMLKVREGFKKRDKSDLQKKSLLKCLSLYIVCLHWMNRRSVQTNKVNAMSINTMLFKPVNCEERLQFIINNPYQYHAFVQLEQLFGELEKSFYKALAMNKL